MNNSFLALEEVSLEKDSAVKKERIGKLTTLIEATAKLKASDAWSTLKETIYGEIEYLERLQKLEAAKREIDAPELYRLQGRLFEAKNHSFDALEEKWRTELLSLRKQQ